MFGFTADKLMFGLNSEKNGGLTPPVNGHAITPEEAELAHLGYKQEFKREFSWISTFSFAFSISGLLATVLGPVLSTDL
jgi:hypothetical protein